MRRFPSAVSPVAPHRARVLDERAHAMRSAPTASEARLFDALRGGRLGVAFRRQVLLVGRYIADLFAPSLGLVVEIDGGYHSARAKADARRDRALARSGYRVLRIEAALVMSDLEEAVTQVQQTIDNLRERVTSPNA